jgi:predicted transcriptional regulator
MSTYDVPGNRPENRDQLAMGCWAEHEDGSLIFVESTEGGRVIYSIFDMEKAPVTEYRDSMAEGAFKKQYSHSKDKKKDELWTWHDKTAFPWDRIIKAGAKDGVRHASADDLLTAAERVRRSREIHRGEPVDHEEVLARVDQLGEKAEGILRRIQKAISELPAGKSKRR